MLLIYTRKNQLFTVTLFNFYYQKLNNVTTIKIKQTLVKNKNHVIY